MQTDWLGPWRKLIPHKPCDLWSLVRIKTPQTTAADRHLLAQLAWPVTYSVTDCCLPVLVPGHGMLFFMTLSTATPGHPSVTQWTRPCCYSDLATDLLLWFRGGEWQWQVSYSQCEIANLYYNYLFQVLWYNWGTTIKVLVAPVIFDMYIICILKWL